MTNYESALRRIAAIEIERGMDADEAVERGMSAVHFARQALAALNASLSAPAEAPALTAEFPPLPETTCWGYDSFKRVKVPTLYDAAALHAYVLADRAARGVAVEAAERKSNFIAGSEVVTPPGAAIKATVLHLTEAGREALTAKGVKSIPAPALPAVAEKVEREPVATGRTHELKTDPEVFEAVWSGAKTFEIRRNDREGGFQVGDALDLRETRFTGDQMRLLGKPLEYTGRRLTKVVSHMLSDYGLSDHWVCMSFAATPPAQPVAPVVKAQAGGEALTERCATCGGRLIGMVGNKCPHCGGAGRLVQPVSKCLSCFGTGVSGDVDDDGRVVDVECECFAAKALAEGAPEPEYHVIGWEYRVPNSGGWRNCSLDTYMTKKLKGLDVREVFVAEDDHYE